MSAKNKNTLFFKSPQATIKDPQMVPRSSAMRILSGRPSQNPEGKRTGPDYRALEKEARRAKKASLRAKKAALRNVRETFKQLPGTSGGRRSRNTRRARK